MSWWLVVLIPLSWAIVWFAGYMTGESCGWAQYAEIARGHRSFCGDCGEPIEEQDDEAKICIQCGGMNRRFHPTRAPSDE